MRTSKEISVIGWSKQGKVEGAGSTAPQKKKKKKDWLLLRDGTPLEGFELRMRGVTGSELCLKRI